LRKLHVISDYEVQSLKSHILLLIRKYIKEYEAVHGEIDVETIPDDTIKS